MHWPRSVRSLAKNEALGPTRDSSGGLGVPADVLGRDHQHGGRSVHGAHEGLDGEAGRTAMCEHGYAMPHWPMVGNAKPIEQLAINEKFEIAAADVSRPTYPPTSYVTLTLLQLDSEGQIAHWVEPASRGTLEWCQLLSEPDAAPDAEGNKTRGVRVERGRAVIGEKIWISGAHQTHLGVLGLRRIPYSPDDRIRSLSRRSR